MILVLCEVESGQCLVLRDGFFFLGGIESDAVGYSVLRGWHAHDVQVWWDEVEGKWWFTGAKVPREVQHGDVLRRGSSSALLALLYPPASCEPATARDAAAVLADALEAGDFGCDAVLDAWVDRLAGDDHEVLRISLAARAEALARGGSDLPLRLFALHLLGALGRVDPSPVARLERLLDQPLLRIAVVKALASAATAPARDALARHFRAVPPEELDALTDDCDWLAAVALYRFRARE